MERTESLIRAERKIREANMHLKILAQYKPGSNQVAEYIYAFQNTMTKYNKMKELMESVEDKYDDPEEMDEIVFDAADDVVCSVKAFYNDIKNYQEYEKQVNGEKGSKQHIFIKDRP